MTTRWSRSSTSTWSVAGSRWSLKQANEDYTEEFDPSKYGMADSYDEQGNYIFPEGFDAETNEWLEGFETQQKQEWEARYAEAERRHKMHTTQMEKFAAAAAEAAAAPSDYSSSSSEGGNRGGSSSSSTGASSGGSLASDEQLAALREALGQRLIASPHSNSALAHHEPGRCCHRRTDTYHCDRGHTGLPDWTA